MISLRGVLRLPQLAGIVQDSVKTDITGSEMVRYLTEVLGSDFDDFNVIQLPGMDGYINGVSYFIADTAATQSVIAEHFTPQTSGRTIRSNQPNVRINRSKNRTIRVEVVDATGVTLDDVNIGDMASALLRSNAFNVQTVRIAEPQARTALIDHNNKRASIEVVKIFPYVETSLEQDRNSNYDVTLILGTDFNHYIIF
jgi:hypothetical protein